MAASMFGGCVAEPDGLQWNASLSGPTAGSIGEGDTTDAIPPPNEGGKDDDGGPPKPMGSDTTDAIDDGSSGDAAGGSTSGDGDTATTGDDDDAGDPAPGDPGVQPPSGPWSSCADGVCEPGMGCLQGQSTGAVCTVACAGADPGSCPAAPGDIVAPICLSVAGASVCALDCSGGLPCPDGMACVLDDDDDGPIEVCL